MSREKLQAEAESLARELGRTVDTNLSRAKLEDLVAGLKEEAGAKAPEATPAPPAPSSPAVPAPEITAAEERRLDGRAPKVPYYVAPRKATRVGTKIVTQYTPVKASDFEGGQRDLDDLVARGVVIKN